MIASQLSFDLRPRTWGGAREGAGRKRIKGRSDPAHRERPEHRAYHPVHVVLRTRPDVPRLRRGEVLRSIRKALQRAAHRSDFRVVHVSIQHNHLHLIVEATTKLGLSRGMQGFAIAAARAINNSLERRGKVFAFRYHSTTITNPRQARHALAYVLNNWRRHREDERGEQQRNALVDPYSSGVVFDGWREVSSFALPENYVPLPVARAQTWLLRTGWELGGPKISVRERPGRLGSQG
ncbi:MAG TPA: transposase [Kofleriaceae bacterium]